MEPTDEVKRPSCQNKTCVSISLSSYTQGSRPHARIAKTEIEGTREKFYTFWDTFRSNIPGEKILKKQQQKPTLKAMLIDQKKIGFSTEEQEPY